MDDVDGYPTVRGDRLDHHTDERWAVTLTPDGLLMEGPQRTATVPLSVVYAVRQRPATAIEGPDAARFELEWVTSLGEDRRLSLRSRDVRDVQRMCRVVEAELRDLDADRRARHRFLDWPLAVLLIIGFGLAIASATQAPAPITTYDWTAVVAQFMFDALTVPALYLAARSVVRAWRRRTG